MLLSFLAGGDIREIIIGILLTIPVVLISLSVHEAAHGYVAMKLGDPTAYNLGRVTLNPFKHLHPLGALCMLVFGYGWANPVPINARNFKNPKVGMALSSIAGPVSNIILGIIGAVVFTATDIIRITVIITGGTIPSAVAIVVEIFLQFCLYFGLMNFMLAAFNMIPVPPFDGSRFFSLFLPQKWYFAIMKYERIVMVVVLVGIIILSRVFNFSPFSWVAEKLFFGISNPIYQLFLLILSNVVA